MDKSEVEFPSPFSVPPPLISGHIYSSTAGFDHELANNSSCFSGNIVEENNNNKNLMQKLPLLVVNIKPGLISQTYSLNSGRFLGLLTRIGT